MTSQDYYDYIEQLASANTLVKHHSREKHFFRGELEEFYMDLRNKVRFPAVIAESFELSWEEDAEFKNRETSFIIASEYKGAKNWDNINTAFDLCERIGDEFLRRIMYDADEGGLCAGIIPLSAVPVLNEQHLYAGIRYTIYLKTPFDTEVNPDMWEDVE